MKRIIVLVLLAAVAWFVWGKYQERVRAERAAEITRQAATKKALPTAGTGNAGVSFFSCDGRNICSQMKSCEEARFFIKTCPGFNSGVFGEEANCEQHWCKK